MTIQQAEKLSKLLESIDINVVPQDIKDIKDINELRDYLEDNNFFDVEIFYYHKAMEYLLENDASLDESMELAQERGYELKDINSELLASLLASQNKRKEFEDLTGEVEKILA